MTKQELKKQLKQFGLYDLIHDLVIWGECYTIQDKQRAESVIFSVLDNINADELAKAIKKASR